MPRLFVALIPPPDVQRALVAAAEPLAAACDGAARLVAPGRVHLTLRFLGDTPDERVPALAAALARAAAGVGPLALAVAGAGAFPSPARAQVLWVGLARDAGLDALHARVEDACAAAGFAREGRPFRAHLTLARLRRGTRVDRARLAAALGAFDAAGAFAADAVDLVASTLAAGGARHEVQARFPLGAG